MRTPPPNLTHNLQRQNQVNWGRQRYSGYSSESPQSHFTGTSYNTSQTVTNSHFGTWPYSEQTYIPPTEPVSLPEATLHQGDAPPAYEEALGMKTVDLSKQ